MDPDARTVDVWKLAEGADGPQVLTPPDTIRWQPRGSTATLELPYPTSMI